LADLVRLLNGSTPRERWVALAIVLGAFASGCATNRSQITLSPPSPPAATPSSRGQTIVIRSVTDERVFEQTPTDPSTPSLGFEGSDHADAALKARAVARKGNTYGKAMGDVVLQAGQTVASVVREYAAAAFESAGFTVASEAASAAAPILVDIHIKEFWAWFESGFWELKLHATVRTDVDVEGAPEGFSVAVQTKHGYQIGNDDSWIEILELGLKDYRAELRAKAAALPIPASSPPAANAAIAAAPAASPHPARP
jgi:uncharacterized lipoprotein YajG